MHWNQNQQLSHITSWQQAGKWRSRLWHWMKLMLCWTLETGGEMFLSISRFTLNDTRVSPFFLIFSIPTDYWWTAPSLSSLYPAVCCVKTPCMYKSACTWTPMSYRLRQQLPWAEKENIWKFTIIVFISVVWNICTKKRWVFTFHICCWSLNQYMIRDADLRQQTTFPVSEDFLRAAAVVFLISFPPLKGRKSQNLHDASLLHRLLNCYIVLTAKTKTAVLPCLTEVRCHLYSVACRKTFDLWHFMFKECARMVIAGAQNVVRKHNTILQHLFSTVWAPRLAGNTFVLIGSHHLSLFVGIQEHNTINYLHQGGHVFTHVLVLFLGIGGDTLTCLTSGEGKEYIIAVGRALSSPRALLVLIVFTRQWSAASV